MTPQPLPLPDSLVRQIDGFRRALWRAKSARALAVVVAVAGLAFLIGFASDRLWETPTAWRAGGAGGALCAGAFSLLWLLGKWIWPYRSPLALARLARRHERRLGDRLLGALEIAVSREGLGAESAELRQAALEQVARDVGRIDLARVVLARASRRPFWIAGAVVLLVSAISFAATGAAANALSRLAKPWADIPRLTFTRLASAPKELVVPLGESAFFEARLAPESRWRPGSASLRIGERSLTTQLEGDGYAWELPALTEPRAAKIAVGDARVESRIIPLPRPEMRALRARRSFPEYLGLESDEIDVTSGRASAVEGTIWRLEGEFTRPAKEVVFTPPLASAPSLAGARFSTPDILPSPTAEHRITWLDDHGLTGKAPFLLALQATPDAPPRIELTHETSGPVIMLEDEAAELNFRAGDDFGLREIGLRWEPEAKDGKAPTANSMVVRQGSPRTAAMSGAMSFQPKRHGLTPQTLRLTAYALDYKPGRELALSSPVTARIVDPVEHARLVRERFGDMRRRIEHLGEEERSAWEANQRLAAKSPEDLAKSGSEIAERKATAERNAQQWRQLEERAQRLLQSAMRNQQLDAAALQGWSEMMGTMNAVANQDLPAAAQALNQAAQAGAAGQGEEARERLQDALEAQEAALAKMAKLANQARKVEGQLEAGSFVQRLKRAADAEAAVATTMRESLPRSAGLTGEELPDDQRGSWLKAAQDHQGNERDVNAIIGDLRHYHERVDKPRFAALADEMEQAQVGQALTALTERVRRNQGARSSVEATRWAERLRGWAEALDPASAGGEQSGEGGASVDFALLLEIGRLTQREIEVRRQTRLLEEAKSTNPRHAEDAKHWGQEQAELRDQAGGLLFRHADSPAAGALQIAAKAMTDAANLLAKAETGGPTLAAEAEAIEALVNAGQSSPAGGGKKSEAQEGMEQMLASMRIGQNAGGNPSGGLSSTANEFVEGDSALAVVKERRVDKAGGEAGSEYPEEFREAMQDYFRRVEKGRREGK